MHISQQGLEFIREEEGCILTWYQDQTGNWTIGVGHMNNSKILPSGFTAPLTPTTATQLLNYDIPMYEDIVNAAFPSHTFTQPQYDALVSFAFNLGMIGNDLKTAIDNGVTGEALRVVFGEYVYSSGVRLQDLVNRRNDEYYVFQFGTYGTSGNTGGTGGGNTGGGTVYNGWGGTIVKRSKGSGISILLAAKLNSRR